MRNQHLTPRLGPVPTLAEPEAAGLVLPKRSDPLVRRIARQWRTLTSPADSAKIGPGAPTLVACSGGGDSCGLAIALAVAAGRQAAGLITLAHVVHDLRPPAQALADRDNARRLASALGLRFLESSVRVAHSEGNAEGNARRARYDALARLAKTHNLGFIATAHNSHDQVESFLMALLRGAGPKGLAGIAQRRSVQGVQLVRPMLTTSPAEARSLCRGAGWCFAHDATNDDPTRLRNALRSGVLPALLTLRPNTPARVAAASQHCADAATTTARLAKSLAARGWTERGYRWERATLRRQTRDVLGETFRLVASRLAGDGVLDRLPARSVMPVVKAIQSHQTDPKVYPWPGLRLNVTAHEVTLHPNPSGLQ